MLRHVTMRIWKLRQADDRMAIFSFPPSSIFLFPDWFSFCFRLKKRNTPGCVFSRSLSLFLFFRGLISTDFFKNRRVSFWGCVLRLPLVSAGWDSPCLYNAKLFCWKQKSCVPIKVHSSAMVFTMGKRKPSLPLLNGNQTKYFKATEIFHTPFLQWIWKCRIIRVAVK